MQTITTAQAAHLIRNSNGKIFTAEVLTKKLLKENPGVPESNLSPRVFNARIGVHKGVTGAGRKFAPGADLIQVGELPTPGRNEKGHFQGAEFQGTYRFIWVNGIRGLRIGGQSYSVVPE